MAEEKHEIDIVDAKGTVSYANDVVATIAGLAATEVEGVAGMSGGISSGIAELLGRKNLTKGVKVEVGSSEAAIDLNVIVTYGACIPEVCMKVQSSVKKAVETMTGLTCVEVNIFVQGVQFEKETKEPEPPRVR
nr:Asp23/Gls24 family envelope stress response protein [bacterium]